jgi:FtsP/CotA-like multicopper oxidase with cupredoxin domain
MGSQGFSRRDFLKAAGFGSAALVFNQHLNLPGLKELERNQPQPFAPDAEIWLNATDTQMQILSGAPTRVYSYEGKLLSGSGVTVEDIPGSYLGPILRVKRGTRLRIFLHNNLIEDTVMHPHGPRVPEGCDGHPMQAIGPGQTKVYEFEVIDRAGPYWFHPHPHLRTAEQVMMGLAGLLYVWDEEEESVVPGASTGTNDVPIVIQDRSFDQNNQIIYQPDMMWGFLGNRILVNGKPKPTFSLEPRGYRLRLLNGSNARTYKLAWSNNMPLQVIGTDGGLLPAPVYRDYMMLMPGERIDIWAEFGSLAGKQVFLRSLAFEAGGMGMMSGGMRGMGMMGGSGGISNGATLDILTVNVGKKATTKPLLAPLPALSEHYAASNVPNYDTPRPFTISMGHMMTWTINGRVFEMEAVAEDEIVNANEPMAWEWINNSPIPHPMHIHNVQFQVVQRIAPASSNYSTVNQGFVDSGWKDTVSVWPGERVKIAMKFGPHTGMYMYHCHILEHEDMTMMRNLMIMDPTMPGM